MHVRYFRQSHDCWGYVLFNYFLSPKTGGLHIKRLLSFLSGFVPRTLVKAGAPDANEPILFSNIYLIQRHGDLRKVCKGRLRSEPGH